MISGKKYLMGLMAGAAVLVAGQAIAQERVLRVTNWAEYIAEDTISNFEAEYGITVVYDNYDSAEAIDSKLLAGNSGYDVVMHAAAKAARLIPAGIIQPFDKAQLPNLKHLDPTIMAQTAEKWDYGSQYIIPHYWGTHGVTYNEAFIKETYPDAPIGSMEMIFDPVHMKELAKCGVAFLDAPSDMVPMALAYLGLQPDSTDAADYEKAGELLNAVRPYVKSFDNYAYQYMPQKEFCVAVTWGPDGLYAMDGAAEAGTGVELDFFVPPGEGAARFWVDGWVIPADAQNVADAHLFLNYLMRPEVGAADSNYTWYATANKTAIDQGMVDEAVLSSPAAYPTSEQIAQMYTLSPLPPRAERVLTRVWTDFKAGN